MKLFKEYYKRYSLFAIIIILGIIIFLEFTPFVSGVLGAMTIYVLLRGQMKFLTERLKFRRGLAATLLIGECIILFLVPLSLVVTLVIQQLSEVNLNPQSLMAPIQSLAHFIAEKTGYDVLTTENLNAIMALLPKAGSYMMNGISSMTMNLVVLVLILFYMLLDRVRMEAFVYEMLPFSEKHKREIMREMNRIVTSNAIGIPLLAVIQGGLSWIGYTIFGVPSPLMFAFLTGVASVVPIVGTGLVWVPLAGYLIIIGDWPNAIGLLCFGALFVAQMDSLIRLILQKKLADTHPLVTMFGVMIGLSLFGFMGIIFGPLLLSLFLVCLKILRKEYLS
jgi:predicted PurR-regulated permease PerM